MIGKKKKKEKGKKKEKTQNPCFMKSLCETQQYVFQICIQ